MKPRVAAIDIGTNTVLLLVAEQAEDGTLVAVEEHARITRLGQGVDRTGKLDPDAVARTNAVLAEYGAIAKRLGAERRAVVGTSAMRDAAGGEAVRAQVEAQLGVPAAVLSGDEEARLTFRGALSGIEGVAPTDDVRVFDIGGGSTEVVHGRRAGEVAYARSYDVGSVRLTERHVRTDPPTADELRAVAADASAAFAEVPEFQAAHPPVGIAGTMTTLAACSLKMTTYDSARVHGRKMSLTTLRALVAELAALPLAERTTYPGLEPKRADVIVAGGTIALAYLDRVGATEVLVSDRGVRWGLAESLVAEG